ncbi:unnamed protein product [Euphydryas editha]|uniref:Uncharacterized protein n=1 Tax=Euphydryas editha TaxID=104508 RepID=A0AAU9V8X2_EUPED|nr:unnamed protein product [Euphydryas editha]
MFSAADNQGSICVAKDFYATEACAAKHWVKSDVTQERTESRPLWSTADHFLFFPAFLLRELHRPCREVVAVIVSQGSELKALDISKDTAKTTQPRSA